ncbi:MAG: carbohydrate ABC transporter permease [Clostridiaceae bacterium]|nr:carbohydrate ABC transporter permease [Clostridiaceae bacterium]
MIKRKIKGIYRKTWFDYIDFILLLFITVITFYPFWSVLVLSLNDPTDALAGRLWFWPRVWTFNNYIHFFERNDFISATIRSIARTVIGALSSVLFTAAVSYGISKNYLRGQKIYLAIIMFTMYVSGGLIPTFLVIKSLGLYQNFLVYIIPALFSSYNGIIMFTYFKTIPVELEESVKVDGGNDLVIFFKIVIPVSMPMMATITLFNAVGQWNSWFDTLLYGGGKLMTLQGLLVTILRDVTQAKKLTESGKFFSGYSLFKPTVESVKATSMMITAIPIIMVYPFLQKYFVKGIMIGSLKG